ncbi:auxin efflux carrier [Chytriomyces sp. MP71]|nr:auxin efflux carrier [Chytriomyces sp. MP71]
MIRLTSQIFWAACSPFLSIAIVLGVGFYLARSGTVTAKDSKLLSTILINILYPALLFTNVLQGVSSDNVKSFLIMTLASFVILATGSILGYIVLLLTNPPSDFRYGTILATAMGNYGDMVLAVVISLGNQPPFSNGDSAKGVAYVAAFICFSNIFFFTIGYKYIGEDFKHLRQPLVSAADSIAIGDVEQKGSTIELLQATSSSSSEEPSVFVMDAKVAGSDLEPITSSPSQNEETHSVPIQDPSALINSTRKWYRPQLSARTLFWLTTLFNPCTVSTILGLTCTMIPSLRSLFYTPDPTVQSPLAFTFKSMTLLGGAAVPVGILNVGTALGRLSVRDFAPARVIGGIAVCRLVLMPVLGIVSVQALVQLEAAVPTASTTVYLTQFWHPEGAADAIASVIVVQYGIAIFTMTFALAIMLSSLQPLKV